MKKTNGVSKCEHYGRHLWKVVAITEHLTKMLCLRCPKEHIQTNAVTETEYLVS